MALRLALVIDGDQSGAKKALEDTATGIGKVQEAAGKAAQPVKDVAEGLKTATTEAGTAAVEIPKVGEAVEGVGTKFTSLKTAAIGAIGGIAGALAGAALGALLEAASGAFTAYVNNIISSGPQVKAALDEHAALVKSIKGFWTDNSDAASNYGSVSGPLLAFKAQQDIITQQDALKRLQSDALTGGGTGMVLANAPGLSRFGLNDPTVGSGTEGTPFQDTVARFRDELKAGTADAIAFQKEVAAIATALPETDVKGRSLAEDLLGDTNEMVKVQTALQQARDLYAGLKGDADAAATALGKSAGQFVANNTAATAGIADVSAYAAALERVAAAPVLGASYTSAELPPATPRAPQVTGGGFKDGGPTGDHIPADRIAGFVHGKEYVFDAASTARIGVANLEAIRRGVAGYARGGYVGSATSAAGSIGGPSWADTVGDLVGGLVDLRGVVRDFAQDLVETGDPLKALGNVAIQTGISILDGLANTFAQAAGDGISSLISGAFRGLLGGSLGNDVGSGAGSFADFTTWAGIGHTGAIIGGAGAGRAVPMSVFANAPRHHSGTDNLQPGEVPFIGKAGEEIGWPDQLAKKYGGGFTFAPSNVFNLQGSNISEGQLQAALDQRDRALNEQFAGQMRYYLDNPYRMGT